jgi:hypothetical protein
MVYTLPNTFTLVQHSAFGYMGDPTFEKGLEIRGVTGKDATTIRAAGGFLGTYEEAEGLADVECYEGQDNVLIPNARGEFLRTKIDGLRLYVPVSVVVL